MCIAPFDIVNYKISFHTKGPNFTQTSNCKKHGNFFVYKDHTFCLTIFKLKHSEDRYHINASKLKTKSDIQKVLLFVKEYFSHSIKEESVKVDNITAKGDFGHSLNLFQICERKPIDSVINYHPAIFPGLYLKHKKGTVGLFTSGKYTIVGCKNSEDIYKCYYNTKKWLDSF